MKARPDSTQAPIPVEFERDDDAHHIDAPPPYTAEELTGSIPQPGDTGVTGKRIHLRTHDCANAKETTVASTLT
jgi:hypothetical protein